MADRWVLHRAGITNVYQYGDEILRFGGGRLLLRGVNGSGKSTAMNMLLPFLLEADTRRIDAAGEQSGVLRSWMLSGRDEQQPVGYLWIELRRPGQRTGEPASRDESNRDDEYLAFGCGIRANRSTDRVTTWWFVTDRRPGIDLALVESRTPLSADSLRATLGPGAVFAHDQRASYRAELRNRLYGGADLDQHLRLLHIIRSPRVGDRIDLDLPAYLTDALPQLSEPALDDAAQPLEDLEEHRRNVEDLTRTATALEALDAGYRTYARTELHRRAKELTALADECRRRERDESRAVEAHRQAEDHRTAAQRQIDAAEGDQARLRTEIDALKGSPAYQAGAELTDLRAHVADLEHHLATATAEVAERAKRRDDALEALTAARDEADDDLADLRRHLSDLGTLAVEAGLAVATPDAPVVATTRLPDPGPAGSGALTDDRAVDEPPVGADRAWTGGHGDGANGTSEPAGASSVDVPAGAPDVDPLRGRLGDLRAATQARRGDLDDVRRALDTVDRSIAALDHAERRLTDADEAARTATRHHADARAATDTAVATWRTALHEWIGRLVTHRADDRLAPHSPTARPGPARDTGAPDIDAPDLAGRRDDVHQALFDAAQATVEHHQRAIASLEARRAGEAATVDELAAVLAELEARTLPDPPSAAWQRAGRGPCLADLVDFRPGINDGRRAGLEAAMEAAGLVGAELTTGGELALADGQLVALPGHSVAAPLSELLTVTVPAELDGAVDTATVAAVLDDISTNVDDLTAADDRTVVTTDGRFRTGLLRGRHAKDRAEHIGVTARRAALARRRAEAAAALDEARSVLGATDDALAARRALADDATALRRSLPSPAAVADAVVRADHAEQALATARDTVARRRQERLDAERTHAEAVDASRRLAATLSLPADRRGLDRVGDTLREVTGTCDRCDAAVRALVRSTAAWDRQADAWQRATEDAARSVRTRDELERRYTPVAMKLATLEDSVGAEYDEIVAAIALSETDLAATVERLEGARAAHIAAVEAVTTLAGDVTRARDDRTAAEGRCVAGLAHLRRVLAVPGLVASAVGDVDAAPDHVAGGDPAAPTDGDTTNGSPSPGDDAGSTPAGLDGSATGGTSPRDRSTVAFPAGPDGDATGGPQGGTSPGDRGTVAFPVVDETSGGARTLAAAVGERIPPPEREATAEAVRQSLRQRRDTLGAGWDAEDHQPDETLPLTIEVTGPLGRMPLPAAATRVGGQLRSMAGLLTAKQDQALRNLLQGLIAREVAEKLHASRELVGRINDRLASVRTSHGIGVTLRWTRRDDLDATLADTIDLLAKPPDLRTADEDRTLTAALSERIADARRDDPEAAYRELIARVLDYRAWFRMALILHRPGRSDERLTRRTALSEGEKKMVSYLPLFAAVAASCDALAEHAPAAPRFVLLDDAFAKVSEDNHAKLFGLLVDLDLDFIATSERLWGTHATVPELAITEVLRDADLGVIVLEHSRWDGTTRTDAA